jgi:hypothetical protein
MATNISKKLAYKASKNFYGLFYKYEICRPSLVILKKVIIKITNFIRFCKTKCLEDKNKIDVFDSIPEVAINSEVNNKLDEYKDYFLENQFCYIENIFNENYYLNLKNTFPDKNYFYCPTDPLKNYNFGFRYNIDDNYYHYQLKNYHLIKKFPILENLYKYIQNSKEFSSFINELISKKNFRNISILSSYANEKSFLIPHMDSVVDDKSIPNIINIIYFVDGLDDAINSGGTGIYSDNEFKDPIFIPSKIKNSMLIYNSKSQFYHGFNFMKKNSYRFAITCEFKDDS